MKLQLKTIIYWITIFIIPIITGIISYIAGKQLYWLNERTHLYSVIGEKIKADISQNSIMIFYSLDADNNLFNSLSASNIKHNQIVGMLDTLLMNIPYNGIKPIRDKNVEKELKQIYSDVVILTELNKKWNNFSVVSITRYKSISESALLTEKRNYAQQYSKIYSKLSLSIEELKKSVRNYYNLNFTLYFVLFIISLLLTISIGLYYMYMFGVFKKRLVELKIMYESFTAAVNEEIGEYSIFVKKIINNNFTSTLAGNYHYSEFSKSLITLKNKLLEAATEQENQQQENEKRNWATHGLAKFSVILRESTSDIYEFSYNIISNLVKYLEANQGMIFILNDDNPSEKFLELTSAYAYDNKKFLQKKILIGEGLTGMCFLEKKTINLQEVPEDYIKIRSGLGDAPPRSVIIVPLKLNDEVFGIIEIASFNKIENYQIEFVEKLGESICADIKNVKVNKQTALLLEQSKEQAEEMKAQEEEMWQNMEELAATQEELSRKAKEQKEMSDKIQQRYEREIENLRAIIKEKDEALMKANKN
ncbi:MAG: GAF domain-containing protein [Bacteroidales bacterium]